MDAGTVGGSSLVGATSLSEGTGGLRPTVSRPGVVFIDGVWSTPEAAKISVFDHGLLYGDGVFEGIRFYEGRVFKLDRHLERMFRSAAGIGLVPPIDLPGMRALVLEACARSGLRDGYLRPIFTRGEGDLGIDPRKSPVASVIVICSTIASFAPGAGSGIRVIVATRRKTPAAALDPTVKSLNYLNNILAKAEANSRRADEAILLDLDGNVAEGSAENIFLVRDGRLLTPPTTVSLEGVTRETILELARGRMVTEVRPVPLPELFEADEVFLTGTGGEVLPVVEVDGRRIGDGRPGEATTELRRDYFDLVRSTGTTFRVGTVPPPSS